MSKLIEKLTQLQNLSPDEIVKRISDPWIKGSDMTHDQHEMLLSAPGDRPVAICHRRRDGRQNHAFVYDGAYHMQSFNMTYVQEYLRNHYFCLETERVKGVWPQN